MAQSNIYMNTIATSTGEASVDLSGLKNITIKNIDGTNTVTIAWDESTTTATKKVLLGNTSSTTHTQAFGANGRGGTLYYVATASTPSIQVFGYYK